MRRLAAGLALAAAAFLGTVWVRVALGAREELAAGLVAEEEGRVEDALVHYLYSMRWYSPLASAPRQAAGRLQTIADDARAQGRPRRARAALQDLRGGILATRSLYSPFGDRLEAVNEQLAQLLAAEQLGQPSAEGRGPAALEAEHLRLLGLDATPAPAWSLLVVLAFLGWVGGGLMTIFRGLDRRARIVRGPALRWGALTATCFALWIVGLLGA